MSAPSPSQTWRPPGSFPFPSVWFLASLGTAGAGGDGVGAGGRSDPTRDGRRSPSGLT